MKLKHKTFILLGFLALLNCETRFEDDTRILVVGNIEDGLGNPVSDAEIGVYRGENYIFPLGLIPSFDDEYLLGQNYSDSEGNFAVTSLYDKNLYFKIFIDAGNSYSKYIYQSNTENYIPDDLTFDLGNLVLYKIGQLNISILNETNSGNNLEFTLRYINFDCIEIYDEGILNNQESSCYRLEIFNRSLDETNPNFEESYAIPIGTQVEFTYSLNNGPEITEVINFNEDNYEFSFGY